MDKTDKLDKVGKVERILQYRFQNHNLLIQALTHSSITTNERKNYERLEFLGDRVLGMIIAELLVKTYTDEKEGELSQRHVKLVCAETVAGIVKKLGLDQYIRTQDVKTAETVNVMCDVGEAVIGAIFLDSDFSTVKLFVERNWKEFIENARGSQKDSKTALQEKMHAMKFDLPLYEVIERRGTQHEPTFVVKVVCADGMEAIGEGHSKKSGEQDAAAKILKMLEQDSKTEN